MEKKCRVGIVFCGDDKVHSAIALDIFKRLQLPSLRGAYEPGLISTQFNERDFRLNMLGLAQKKFDFMIPIGEYFSLLTKQVYEELSEGYQTAFVAVIDPIKLGLVQSLEKPGGFMSGVSMEMDLPIEYPEKVALFYPYIGNILLPYGPECLSGLLDERAHIAADYLRSVGFSVTMVPIHSANDAVIAFEDNVDLIDSVMLLEGCFSTMSVNRLAYLSWLHKKLLFGNNCKEGVAMGATCSYGRDYGDLAEIAVKMVHRYWDDRRLMSQQPVITLPSNRVFIVNEPWLRQIGDVEALVEKLCNTSGVTVVRFWPASPSVIV